MKTMASELLKTTLQRQVLAEKTNLNAGITVVIRLYIFVKP